MTLSRPKLGFCVTIAVIAASLADPFVEFASNAGWFGPGNYTDHSNADVLPVLLAGVALLALYLVRKARAILTERAPSTNVTQMLPAIFVFQVAALYVVETAEQLIVWHHCLGPLIWLGGPVVFALAVHAVVGAAVALTISRSKRTLATTTLRIMATIRAIGTFAQTDVERSVRPRITVASSNFLPVCCIIGKRAPPPAIV